MTSSPGTVYHDGGTPSKGGVVVELHGLPTSRATIPVVAGRFRRRCQGAIWA